MTTVRDRADNTDRVAIVTGGARGVGREIACTLAGQGYAVAISYLRDQTAADVTVDEILACNGVALAVRADVADDLDVERLYGETAEAFGAVDVAVHAAGHSASSPSAAVVGDHARRQLRDGGALVIVTAADDRANAGAVEGLVPALARELRGRDLTVNAVACAADDAHAPRAIAAVVAFLVGADARRVNGRMIRVA